jgi:hypothetical protein
VLAAFGLTDKKMSMSLSAAVKARSFYPAGAGADLPIEQG